MRAGGWRGLGTAGPGGPSAGTLGGCSMDWLIALAISAKPSGLGSVVELIYPAPIGAGGPVRAPSIQSSRIYPYLTTYISPVSYPTPYHTPTKLKPSGLGQLRAYIATLLKLNPSPRGLCAGVYVLSRPAGPRRAGRLGSKMEF